MTDGFLMTGSCQCQQVKYRLSAPPTLSLICHCIECQKLSASAYSPTLVVSMSALEVDGELASYERLTDTGRRNVGYFCPNCGNRIYHLDPDAPQMARLKAGTLDGTAIPEPQAHVWVSRKQPWVDIPEDMPSFEGNLPAQAARDLMKG